MQRQGAIMNIHPFAVLLMGSAVWAGDLPTGPLSDDGKMPATIAEVSVRAIDPPDKGFYAKRLDYRGLPIKGAAEVSDAAFHEAWRRIDNLLHKNPVILDYLRRAAPRFTSSGRTRARPTCPNSATRRACRSATTPASRSMSGLAAWAGRQCSCGEENLLQLPGDRYRGRDILSHEFTHTIHRYGLSPNVQQMITETYRSARRKKLWETPTGKPIYGGSNEDEYLAEMVLWYVGGRGDWPRGMPAMKPGPDFLKSYDPEGFKLVDDLFQGRLEVRPVGSRPRQWAVTPGIPGSEPPRSPPRGFFRWPRGEGLWIGSNGEGGGFAAQDRRKRRPEEPLWRRKARKRASGEASLRRRGRKRKAATKVEVKRLRRNESQCLRRHDRRALLAIRRGVFRRPRGTVHPEPTAGSRLPSQAGWSRLRMAGVRHSQLLRQIGEGNTMNPKHPNHRGSRGAIVSRRRFLASTTAAVGVGTLGGPLLLSGVHAASTAANSKLNLAVVGCGGQGRGVMSGPALLRREPGGPVRSGCGADRKGPGRRPAKQAARRPRAPRRTRTIASCSTTPPASTPC